MKSLTNSKATVSPDGRSVTITADIVDKDYSLILAQRVSIGYLNRKNMRHPRLVQLSNEAIFVKAYGERFAFDFEDLIAIATQVNPKTSFAPVFGDSTSPLAVNAISELPVTYQWQFTDVNNPRKDTAWIDVAGGTSATLAAGSVPAKNWVRCVATNAAGTKTSDPQIVK